MEHAREILYKEHSNNQGCTIYDPPVVASLLGVSEFILDTQGYAGGLTGGMGVQAELATTMPPEKRGYLRELTRKTDDLDILLYPPDGDTISLKTFEKEIYPSIDRRIQEYARKLGIELRVHSPAKRSGFLEIIVEPVDARECEVDARGCEILYLHFKRPTRGMPSLLRELYEREARNAIEREWREYGAGVALLRLEDTIVPKAVRMKQKDMLDLMMLAAHHPKLEIDRNYLSRTLEYYVENPQQKNSILHTLEVIGILE